MPLSASWLLRPRAKALLLLLCLLPLAWLLWAAATQQLGANPAEALVRATGDWTLRALCLVLTVTPLRVLSHTPALARFRRLLGLMVFFYATLHMLAYSWFDMGFELADIARDIAKRPFILVGFSGFVLLLPLALTSSNRAIQALGAARWKALHRLVYAVAVLAVLHFFWMRSGKRNFQEVLVYALILGGLLAWRWRQFCKRKSHALKA